MNRPLALLLVFAAPLGAADHRGVAVARDGRHAWVTTETRQSLAVSRTVDWGTNWTHQTVNTIRTFHDVVFADTLHGWTCGEVGDIWRSRDGGIHWERQYLGATRRAYRIRMLDTLTGLVGGREACCLSSTDGGAVWEPIWLPNPPYDPDTTDIHGIALTSDSHWWAAAGKVAQEETLYSGGDGLVLLTTDAGRSWTTLFSDRVNDLFDIAAFGNGHVVAVGGCESTGAAVTHCSEDGGATWTRGDITGPSAGLLRAVAFPDQAHGFACGSHGTVLRTTDSGRHWLSVVVPPESAFYDIEFADSLRGMACGPGVVIVTTDGGATWLDRTPNAVHEETQAPGPATVRLQGRTNPTAGNVRLTVCGFAGSYDVAVFDASGRVVWRTAGSLRNTDATARIECALPPGAYTALVSAALGSRSTRFVVAAR